jgi:phenylalanyl-tRNA synthetase beta subunit
MFLLNGNRSGKYRQRTDARFVDEKGKDRKLDMDAVSAYMNSVPDDSA